MHVKYKIHCSDQDAAAAKSLQSCLTLCDPIDRSLPGSSVPGILQARTLEWAAISFSKAWKWKVKVKPLSPVWLFETPWTAAYQAPLSMGVSRQEYWSGLPSAFSVWSRGGKKKKNHSSTLQFSCNETQRSVESTFSPSICHAVMGPEGNGTPLQYSCLENPMDGGAW